MYKQIGSYKGQIQSSWRYTIWIKQGFKIIFWRERSWSCMEYGTCCGHDRMVLLYPLIQSVAIITKIMSLILTRKLYNKFVSDLWQVSDPVSFMNKNFCHNITKILNTKINIWLPNLISGFFNICWRCVLKLFTIS